MAYSHSRLRKTLALVRIVTGVLFLFAGLSKISSWEFAGIEFPQYVWDAVRSGAVGFYAEFLNSMVVQHLARAAALVAFTEIFIGVGLVLGLAVRPVSFVGMFYSINLILATWNVPAGHQPAWHDLDNTLRLVLMFFLFLVFGVGHAGENWGLGSLYHRRRNPRWAGQRGEDGPEVTALASVYRRRYVFDDSHRQGPELHSEAD